jgi:hypothetical protein
VHWQLILLLFVEKSRELLKSHLTEVKETCLLTEKALSHENETEILFVKKQVGERLEEYSQMELTPQAVQQQLDDSLE